MELLAFMFFPELKTNTLRSCSENGELNIQLSLTSLWIVQSAPFPKHFAESVLSARVLYTTTTSRLESLAEWHSTEKQATRWEVCHQKGGFGARHFPGTKPREEVGAGERWPALGLSSPVWVSLKEIFHDWQRDLSSSWVLHVTAAMCQDGVPLCHRCSDTVRSMTFNVRLIWVPCSLRFGFYPCKMGIKTLHLPHGLRWRMLLWEMPRA